MAEKWVKIIFPDHGVNRKVVDNDNELSKYEISAKSNDAFQRKWIILPKIDLKWLKNG